MRIAARAVTSTGAAPGSYHEHKGDLLGFTAPMGRQRAVEGGLATARFDLRGQHLRQGGVGYLTARAAGRPVSTPTMHGSTTAPGGYGVEGVDFGLVLQF